MQYMCCYNMDLFISRAEPKHCSLINDINFVYKDLLRKKMTKWPSK